MTEYHTPEEALQLLRDIKVLEAELIENRKILEATPSAIAAAAIMINRLKINSKRTRLRKLQGVIQGGNVDAAPIRLRD